MLEVHSPAIRPSLRILLASVLCIFTGCAAPRQEPSYPVSQHYVPSQPQSKSKPKPQPRPQPQKSTGPIIFLDAGHGGRDGGAAVKATHLQEKALSLEIVKRIERLLIEWKYNVSLSRRGDVFVPLQKRVAMAANANASIFVSVHFNSAASRKSRGSEIYYFSSPKSIRSADSKRLGTCILRCLCEGLPAQYRGIKHGDFCVIRETSMPAVLVEAAFITNPQEARLLASGAYKQRIASAIAKGINDYFHPK